MAHKTLVVGLDAACWQYLDPLLADGRLPTLQKLIDTGISGTLRSTIPAITATAWASIVTGKNPGKTGIFEFLWRQPHSYNFRTIDANKRKGTPFWQHLNAHGIRVGLVNVPFSYPLTPLDGYAICGFGTPPSAADFAYPSDLVRRIQHQHSDYQPWLEPHQLKNASAHEIIAADELHQQQQVRMANEASSEYGVDVLVINLMLADHANHFAPEMSQVEEAICQSDADIGRLIDGFQPDNIMLISDHGSRRVEGYVLLHEWLREKGYVTHEPRPASESANTLNWILALYLQDFRGWNGLTEKLARRALTPATRALPGRYSQRLWDTIEEAVPFARNLLHFSSQPDYSKTKVFPGSKNAGLFYANAVDCAPSGWLTPTEANQVLEQLAEELSSLCDPDTGAPVFSEIYTPDRLYDGPYVQSGPDLIADSYDARWIVQYVASRGSVAERQVGKYFVTYEERTYGQHSRDGIFIFSGKDFISSPLRLNGHIMDVPATLLHLYDIPIPEDFDGRVLEDTFKPDLMAQRPVRHQPGDNATMIPEDELDLGEDTQGLVEQLRMLGYLE